MDVAGTVTELADDVDTGLAVGDAVVAVVVPSGEHGAYREDLVLPAGSVVAAPQGASAAEASTLPMNALTARMALEELSLAPGTVLAVTGAAGALGGYLVQLAKADGLTVVADAKDTDEDLVRSLGADVVVPRGSDFADAVRAEFPDGVDGLADASVQADEVTHAVKDGGGVATFRGWDGDGDTRLTYHPVLVHGGAERRDLLDRLRQQAEDGTLTLRVAEVLPASEAVEAHRRLEAGGVRGRIVLDWS
jgi:NADPH:quinone reductase-like Zn-dependent oxidoreductase